MSFRLVHVTPSFRAQRSGAVTGRIWVELDSTAFPARDWDDFVLAVIDSFASQVVSIATGKENHVEVAFQDGPYSVFLSRLPNRPDDVLVTCARRNFVAMDVDDDLFVTAEAAVPLQELVTEVAQCGDSALLACYSSDDLSQSSDLSGLESRLFALHRLGA